MPSRKDNNVYRRASDVSRRLRGRRFALTLLEVVIALVIMAVVMAALLPQFRNIENSWASKQGNAEALQNGRILVDHIHQNLCRAERVTAVSAPDVVDGFIEYEAEDGLSYRYDIAANRNVQFGMVGSLSELAGPVSCLQFRCYSAYDLDNVTTDLLDIRCVRIAATLQNTADMGMDKHFTATAYLSTNSVKNLPPLYKEPASSFEFNVVEGGWPALARVDTSHYLCSYMGPNKDGWAAVVMVDSDTWTVRRGAPPLEFDTKNGEYSALIRIDEDHFLCAYTGAGGEGTAAVLKVNKALKKVKLESSMVFDNILGMFPSFSNIDATHYLCAYTGKSAEGRAVVLSIDTLDWSVRRESAFTFDTDRGMTPAVLRIDESHHLCVYSGNFDRGVAVVFSVNTGTWNISKEMPTIIDPARFACPAACQIDASRYMCVYAGASNQGRGTVLQVTPITWSITAVSRFAFDGKAALFADLKKIEDARYLCVYEGPNSDAWSNVLFLDVGSWRVTAGIPVEYDPAGGRSPATTQIDTNHFLCVYQGRNNDGWAAILNTEPPVLP